MHRFVELRGMGQTDRWTEGRKATLLNAPVSEGIITEGICVRRVVYDRCGEQN